MEVEDVKLRGPGADLAQHNEMARGMVADAGEAQPLRGAGDELGRRPRTAAGEQRYLIAEADELFPARVGSRCGWCDFRSACAAGQAVPRRLPWAGVED